MSLIDGSVRIMNHIGSHADCSAAVLAYANKPRIRIGTINPTNKAFLLFNLSFSFSHNARIIVT